jgi:hypothetical protein
MVDQLARDESCSGSKYNAKCAKNQGTARDPSARVITSPAYATDEQNKSAGAGQPGGRSELCRRHSEPFSNPQSVPTGKRHSARPCYLVDTKHFRADFQKPSLNATRRGSREANF